MAGRRPAADERQADIFGAILPAPPAPEPPPSPARRRHERKQGRSRAAPLAPDGQGTPAADAALGLDALAACLSAAELDELAAALPDDALAHLVLAAAHQLRRRLARTGGSGRGGKRRGSAALERAARQLAAELGEEGRGDDA